MSLEQFKARLKAKSKTLGAASLSQKRIDALAAKLHAKNPDITEDADHDTQIDAFNELMPLADIAREDDRVRTLEAKAKGQQQNGNQGNTDDDDDADDDDPPANKGKGKKKNADEPPAWAKSLIETVNTLKTEKVQTSMREKAAAKLKDIPAKFYAGRTPPEKEEDLDAYVESITNDYTEFKQDLVNQGLMSASAAPNNGGGGPAGDKALDAGIENWAKEKSESKEQK